MVKMGIYEEFIFVSFQHYDMDMVRRLMAIMLFIMFYTKSCPLPVLTKNPYLAPDLYSSTKAKSTFSFYLNK